MEGRERASAWTFCVPRCDPCKSGSESRAQGSGPGVAGPSSSCTDIYLRERLAASKRAHSRCVSKSHAPDRPSPQAEMKVAHVAASTTAAAIIAEAMSAPAVQVR